MVRGTGRATQEILYEQLADKRLAYKEVEMLSSLIELTHFSTIRITVWALKFAKPWPSKGTPALTLFW